MFIRVGLVCKLWGVERDVSLWAAAFIRRASYAASEKVTNLSFQTSSAIDSSRPSKYRSHFLPSERSSTGNTAFWSFQIKSDTVPVCLHLRSTSLVGLSWFWDMIFWRNNLSNSADVCGSTLAVWRRNQQRAASPFSTVDTNVTRSGSGKAALLVSWISWKNCFVVQPSVDF